MKGVDHKSPTEMTMTNETKLKSPEKLEPKVQNDPDRAVKLLAGQLSKGPEKTSIEDAGQRSSIEVTLTDKMRLISSEKLEPTVHNTT